MGHKSVCVDCRKTFNRGFDSGSGREYKCPDCGKPMTLYPHRFRPPKKSDDSKWITVKYLLEHGFNYQHVHEPGEFGKIINGREVFVEYPENLRDAKEFVEKYKNQINRKLL